MSTTETSHKLDLGLILEGPVETVDYSFDSDVEPTRRTIVQVLGAGLLIVVASDGTLAQERRGGGGRGGPPAPRNVAARVHIGADGAVTVLTGKVEAGQGSRAEITQASWIAGCLNISASTSAGHTLKPEALIIRFRRSVRKK